MKSLYLVDASAMFFRAFFALPPLTNASGMPTNALYGFVSMTIKLLRDCKPDYIVYCFDRKEPSFRNELFSDYKATRDEMPEGLVPQVPYMRKLADALGILCVDRETFEADDVIGSLVQFGRAQDLDVTIVSGDKDFAQLVRPCVTLYDTMKDVRLNDEGVMAKWGIRPDQMVDYLAIVGDTSDNVPGVKGVGPKGAVKLLAEFGSLEQVYANIEKISAAGVRKKMAESKDSAFLAQKLVSIVTNLDMNLKLEDMRLRPVHNDTLVALLQELGFKNFERTLLHLEDAKKPGVAASAKAPLSLEAPAAAKPVVRRAKSGPLTDWETDLNGLSSIEPYADVSAVWSDRGAILSWRDKVIRINAEPAAIGGVLAPKRLRWHGWDLKEVFKNYGLTNELVSFDTKLATYVLRPDKMGTFDQIFERHCGEGLPPLASPVQIMEAHRDLEKVLKGQVDENKLTDVFERFDLPMISALAKMELTGIKIDVDELKSQSTALFEDLARLEKGIFEAAGLSFNIGSPKQLGDILFEKMKLPVGKKTKTGYSTDSEVLTGLVSVNPIASLILEYRELSKLKSTYVDSLPSLMNSKTQRVHTQLNQTLTTTGRLSSSNPNLQNIPIRTPRGRAVRKAFIPEKGRVLISADYSQIELRVLAHMAGDEAMIAAFQQDHDIHAATASEIFSTTLDSVTSEQRRTAKAVNFGIAYGQGAYGLADTLGIGRGEAAEIIERYFRRFPGIKSFMEITIRTAMETGFVETLFGRRRYLDELKSQNPMIRRGGERAAINAPIQGTAADLVKLAMIRLNESLDIPILLQVHDELLFECPADEINDYLPEIRATMENVHVMRVPLKVNVNAAPNWEDAH